MRNIRCLAVLLTVLPYTFAWAAAPDNNGISSATRIDSLPVTIEQNVAEANLGALETKPSCGNLISSSVWFQYTPTSTQNVVLDTFTSNYDTVLTLWGGAPTDLQELACNDDNTVLDFQSQISATLTADTPYYISVGSLDVFNQANEDSQTGNLVLTIKQLAEFNNNNVADATVIEGGLPYTSTQNALGAGNESSELAASCANSGGGVWYRYQATQDGIVVFNTYGSNYDTVLSLWQGTRHPLTELACNNDGNDESVQSQLSYALAAGETYRLKVSGAITSGEVLPASGLLVLNVSEPPVNDDLSRALTIDSLPYTDNQLTAGATDELSEETASCSVGSNSVWYQYTPTTDEYVSFDSLGSDYDTVMGIWTGDAHPLTEVDCNDDAVDPEDFSQSRFALALDAGTTYYISLSSAFGIDGGNLQFTAKIIEPDLNIEQQPIDQTIEAGQRATLNITISGNPIRLHQWYEGAVGDTSKPVGTDDTVLVTPPLTASTQFWVKVTNPTGSVNSRAVTVTVVDGELPTSNGLGLSFLGERVNTTADFTPQLTAASGASGNNLSVSSTDSLTLAIQITTASVDVGKTADIVVAAEFLADPEQSNDSFWFMQSPDGWLPWEGGRLEDLPATATRSLAATEMVEVYQGSLEVLALGQYNVYVGYRLAGETYIVYSGEPARFLISP